MNEWKKLVSIRHVYTRIHTYTYIYITLYYNELNIEIIYPSSKISKVVRFFRMYDLILPLKRSITHPSKSCHGSPAGISATLNNFDPSFRDFKIKRHTRIDTRTWRRLRHRLPSSTQRKPLDEARLWWGRYRPISRFERGRVINIHETVPSRNTPTTSRDATL